LVSLFLYFLGNCIIELNQKESPEPSPKKKVGQVTKITISPPIQKDRDEEEEKEENDDVSEEGPSNIEEDVCDDKCSHKSDIKDFSSKDFLGNITTLKITDFSTNDLSKPSTTPSMR